MTVGTTLRCSVVAEELDEPMSGTVDQRIRWLLVEDAGAWGSEATADLFGPDAVALAKRLRMRLLLVRRSDSDAAPGARRLTLVDTATREMATRAINDIAELSLERVAHAPVGDFGERATGPVFLVCTNGKRDACCALRGRALVAALAGRADQVWECTHLGGHRFAGNLVCLPEGIVYGRVGPADGPRLVDGHRAGRLDPVLLRGRSAWPPAAQVGEQAIRIDRNLTGIDDVSLLEAAVADDRASVTLATPDGTVHRLELRREPMLPGRQTSCRGDEIEEPMHWRVMSPSAS